METDPTIASALHAIGVRIAAIRRDRGFTQEQVAEALDVAPQTIRRIERGQTNAPVGRLVQLASFLGASLTDLVTDAESPPPDPTWNTNEARAVSLFNATPYDQRELLLKVMREFAARR